MCRIKRSILVAVFATVAALLSGNVATDVRTTYTDIMGCEQSCVVAAGGWPFAYIVDYPGISPVGSADLTGALLGLDNIWWLPLVATFVSWTVFFSGCFWLLPDLWKKCRQ